MDLFSCQIAFFTQVVNLSRLCCSVANLFVSSNKCHLNAEIYVSSVIKTGIIVTGYVFLLTFSNATLVRLHPRAEESQS